MSCRSLVDFGGGSRRRREEQRRVLALIPQGTITFTILLIARIASEGKGWRKAQEGKGVLTPCLE